MSPADNAAREPSMDEILASIRRIIEDNDAGQPQASAQKDVLAQVSHAFQGNDVANRPQLNAVVNKGYVPETAAPQISALPSADANYDLTEVPEKPSPEKTLEQSLKPHQIVGSEDVFASAVGEEKGEIVDKTIDADTSNMGTSLANMISNQAAERVSASFGALSEALDANKDSQLTSMTEEMLQPMLREWLDNNLPGIVERLVREEIERLARGEM